MCVCVYVCVRVGWELQTLRCNLLLGHGGWARESLSVCLSGKKREDTELFLFSFSVFLFVYLFVCLFVKPAELGYF